jgi:hypothetical protein
MSFDSSDTVDGVAVSASLTHLLKLWQRNLELELRVSAPARVLAFNPITGTADVRIENLPIKDIAGEAVPDLPILLSGIPVEFPRSGGDGTTFPLLPASTGRVIFSDRALAAWLQTGNPGIPVDPESGRAHNLGDAVFVPGLMTIADTASAGPVDITATVVDGTALVKIGGLAAEFALKGTSLAATASTLQTVLLAVPPATDPVTVIALANANNAAILGLLAALQTSVATKTMIE